MAGRPTHAIIRFGSFELNLEAAELRRNGTKIKLQEQPFQVLALLLAKPGEVVTREELRATLWPADTFVDFDHGLNAAVKRLRDALGDSAENPLFIETLARRGYRFIAPVNGAADASVATASPIAAVTASSGNALTHSGALVPADAGFNGRTAASIADTGAHEPNAGLAATIAVHGPRSRHSRYWKALVFASVILALAVGAGWVTARRFNPRVQIIEQRLTANPIEDPVLGAVISPDHRYVAFADRAGLYLRTTQTDETHRIALPDGFRARPLGWFPDGTHLLVTPSPGANDKLEFTVDKPPLWKVSIFGETPQKLIDNAEGATVSPDGSQIIFLRNDSGFTEIWWMQSNGENVHKLLAEPHHYYSSLAWSPSGKAFAFLDELLYSTYYGGQLSVCIYRLDSGHTDTLLTSPRLATGLAWTPDDRLIYSLTEPPPNQGDSNLWAQKLDPTTDKRVGEAVRLTNGPDAKTNMSLSADGKRLTFLRKSSATSIYVADVDYAQGRLASVEPLHLEQHRQLPYAWTPDSKSVLFVSDRDGPFHLYGQAVDQLMPNLVFGAEDWIWMVRPNPDYSAVLVLVAPHDFSTPTRIMQVPLSGGSPRFILEDHDIHNLQCARAPSWVCVYSREATDRLSFVAFDSVTGDKKPLMEIPGPDWHNWTLSADGSAIALANWRHVEANPTIELVPLKGGAKRAISVGHEFRISSIDFAADGRSIWTVVQDSAGARTLLNVDLHGRVKPMFQENEKTLGWAIPSPDGRHLAFWEASGSSNAWLLQGF